MTPPQTATEAPPESLDLSGLNPKVGEPRAATPEQEKKAKERRAKLDEKQKKADAAFKAKHDAANKRRVYIYGVPFLVQRQGKMVTLHHPAWPIVGTGTSEKAARTRVLDRVAEFAPLFAELPGQFFSGDGKKLREFCIAAAKVIDLTTGSEGK